MLGFRADLAFIDCSFQSQALVLDLDFFLILRFLDFALHSPRLRLCLLLSDLIGLALIFAL